MTNPFKARMMGSAFGMIAIISSAAWAETPVPADIAQEEAFLDVLPKVDVPDDVKPIPGAVNEEWRTCRENWPVGYVLSQDGPEARAYRDIYGFVQARSVVELKDCTCNGKAAPWDQAEAIADELRKQKGAIQLSWAETKAISDTADELISVAETMCGGGF